jgi:hypothetical protein
MELRESDLQSYVAFLESVVAASPDSTAYIPILSNPQNDWQESLLKEGNAHPLEIPVQSKENAEQLHQIQTNKDELESYISYLKRLAVKSENTLNIYEVESLFQWLQNRSKTAQEQLLQEYNALLAAVYSSNEFKTLMTGSHAVLPTPHIPHLASPTELRAWWHNVLRAIGSYKCYGIILALPSDTEILSYLSKFVTELDLLSGMDCLIIAFTRLGFWFWEKEELEITHFQPAIIDDYTNEGHCVQVGEVLGIELTEYPCLVVFHDIRSSRLVTISLKSLDQSAISQVFRSTFSIIKKAVAENRSPIAAIEIEMVKQQASRGTTAVFNMTKDIIGETMQSALESWINSSIK